MKAEIRTGVYNRIVAATSLTSSTLEFDEGKNISGAPFAIIRTTSEPVERDSGTKWYQALYEIDIFCDTLPSGETVEGELDTALDLQQSNIAISGHTCTLNKHTGTPKRTRRGKGWVITMRFEIEAEKN